MHQQEIEDILGQGDGLSVTRVSGSMAVVIYLSIVPFSCEARSDPDRLAPARLSSPLKVSLKISRKPVKVVVAVIANKIYLGNATRNCPFRRRCD
jgi:hypothetical protein